MFSKIRGTFCLIAVLSSSFLAFGLYHVHSFSGVTEGGVLGMTLLLDHWLHISPALSGLIMNLICYGMGWRFLGKEFILYSLLSSLSFSVSYRIWEQFPPLWPQLAEMPLTAAVAGAVFVGIGAGLCVRIGGAPGGDDALALTISRVTGWKLASAYLFTDLIVLALSLSYIPLRRILFSLITVTLSSFLIDRIQNMTFDRISRTTQEGLPD